MVMVVSDLEELCCICNEGD